MENIRKLLFLIGMICLIYLIAHVVKGDVKDGLFWVAFIIFFISFGGYFLKDMIGEKN